MHLLTQAAMANSSKDNKMIVNFFIQLEKKAF